MEGRRKRVERGRMINVLLWYRNQVERDEKKALVAAGQNVTDRVFTAEEVRSVGNWRCGI